jgi:hypothetical protein
METAIQGSFSCRGSEDTKFIVPVTSIGGFWRTMAERMYCSPDHWLFSCFDSQRRVIFGVDFSLSKWTIGDLPKTNLLGYTSSKMSRLRFFYYDEELGEKFRERLKLKSKGGKAKAFAIPFQFADKKRSDTTGNCMLSFVVQGFIQDKGQKHTEIHVFYRTTELLRRFVADIYFLDSLFMELIGPEMLDAVDRVVFHFPSIYVSALWFPIYTVLRPNYKFADPDGCFAKKCMTALDNVIKGKHAKSPFGPRKKAVEIYKSIVGSPDFISSCMAEGEV